MEEYSPPPSPLGERILKFRKTQNLTQADLAHRYKVSGPAIFKFERGFMTPSFKLWFKIAEDMGIPEKEAVLIWAKQKMPARFRKLIQETSELDVALIRDRLEAAGKGKTGRESMREIVRDDPGISPAVKRFVADSEMWGILKPTVDDLVFLIDLDGSIPLLTLEQLRDALMLGRDIQEAGR